MDKNSKTDVRMVPIECLACRLLLVAKVSVSDVCRASGRCRSVVTALRPANTKFRDDRGQIDIMKSATSADLGATDEDETVWLAVLAAARRQVARWRDAGAISQDQMIIALRPLNDAEYFFDD